MSTLKSFGMIAAPALNVSRMGAMDSTSPSLSSPPDSPTSVTTPSSSIWANEPQSAFQQQALQEGSSLPDCQPRQDRWQELERKKLALHRMRQHLEQRIHDFVDREKQAKLLQQSSEEEEASAELPMTSSLASTFSPQRVLLPLDSLPVWKGESPDQRGVRCVSPSPSPKAESRRKGSRRERVEELCFADGQVYQGYLVNGVREGSGTNRWPNGQVYRGEWLANRRHGRGTHSWPDGRSATGEWYKGHLHGRVLVSWPNGASYDGECQAGQKHGRGVWIDSKGSKYSGGFVGDKEHGFGTLTHLDGRKYRGQFQEGEKHGYGIQVWPTRTYDGEWADGKFHGRGKLVWATGATFTGQFLAGSYHGMGVYTWSSGKKYVGQWERGLKHGHGVYTWPNGKKYSGEYNKGKKHGYGRMQWADGRVYCGSWKDGDRWGRGVQTEKDGSVFHCGMWMEDEPVGAHTFPSSSSVAAADMDNFQGLLRDETDVVASRLRFMTL